MAPRRKSATTAAPPSLPPQEDSQELHGLDDMLVFDTEQGRIALWPSEIYGVQEWDTKNKEKQLAGKKDVFINSHDFVDAIPVTSSFEEVVARVRQVHIEEHYKEALEAEDE